MLSSSSEALMLPLNLCLDPSDLLLPKNENREHPHNLPPLMFRNSLSHSPSSHPFTRRIVRLQQTDADAHAAGARVDNSDI
jgi:hypothetical protein